MTFAEWVFNFVADWFLPAVMLVGMVILVGILLLWVVWTIQDWLDR